MRDTADHVRAELSGPAHELAAAVEAEDAQLRERDELQVDQAPDLLAQIDQGAQRGQLRIADIDVAPDVLHAAGQLPPQHLPHARLDVCVGEVGDPVSPDRDALEQGARDIRPWLANGQYRVKMYVRLHQRRRDEPAAEVDGLRC